MSNAPDRSAPPADLVLEPVGVAHTSYNTADEAPHQGFATDDEATIEVFERFGDALAGIDDVVRLLVVYWADGADRGSLARRRRRRIRPTVAAPAQPAERLYLYPARRRWPTAPCPWPRRGG